ncbi:hypothetical protein L5515_010448 [Caenorhabditis briggsae]|uniref:Uncharacterized protein n=1 Tax=Caenorhabditis briggsae TaxID=6238 RepID=A0AAE9JF35_CAEBR|nr:hypothetical protein L5515_010448 [Caenorhabditis briggsae]
MKKMKLRFVLCFVMLMIVGCEAFIDPDIIPPGYVPDRPLDETENQNRLEKCSIPPPLSKKYVRNDTWWIGRLTFGGKKSGNYRFEAALISTRHAIISSEIVEVYPRHLITVRKDIGVGCSSEAPELLEFSNGKDQDPWLIFTKRNGTEQRSQWRKAFYYGRCTTNKTDGIIIVEFEKDIDIPYVCIPDYNYYNSIDKTESVFSVKTLSKESPITKEYEYEAQDGMIERCDDRFCWSPVNQTQDYKKFHNDKGVSMPFLTKDERPLLFGFGFKVIKKPRSFAVTDLADFLEGLCEYVGVCPENRERITPPTTTARTARTTPRPVPTTTDYVPEFLFDEEDFEEPYFKRNRTRKGGTKREWKITVVFMISLVLLVLE